MKQLLVAAMLAAAIGCKKETTAAESDKSDKSEKADPAPDKKKKKSDDDESKPSDSAGKCKYVSAKDVEAIVGHPVKIEENDDDAHCSFAPVAEDKPGTRVNISVLDYSDVGWDICKKGSKKLPDVGDDAYDSALLLCVKQGKKIMQVSALSATGGDEAAMRLKIAKKALAKVKD
jgi:hypothetical protein